MDASIECVGAAGSKHRRVARFLFFFPGLLYSKVDIVRTPYLCLRARRSAKLAAKIVALMEEATCRCLRPGFVRSTIFEPVVDFREKTMPSPST